MNDTMVTVIPWLSVGYKKLIKGLLNNVFFNRPIFCLYLYLFQLPQQFLAFLQVQEAFPFSHLRDLP